MGELKEKFSYTKLDTFHQCPFKYKLVYKEGHYIKSDAIALVFGTMIHHIEEQIGIALKNNLPVDYDKLKIELEETSKSIKEKFPEDWNTKDKSNRTYQEKYEYYKDNAIYRLEKRIKENPNLKVVDLEKKFEFEFKDKLLNGSIDRVLFDSNTNEYIIEDIKTYSVPMEKKALDTPLQHVVYSIALKKDLGEDIKIRNAYDLPLCDLIQEVRSDFYEEGVKSLNETFNELELSYFEPKPTPLCHWCPFCRTNPNQPEEAKNLCPYHSQWTRENKNIKPEFYWAGGMNHKHLLELYINKHKEE